jgi:hypothetical protein
MLCEGIKRGIKEINVNFPAKYKYFAIPELLCFQYDGNSFASKYNPRYSFPAKFTPPPKKKNS